MAFVGRWASRGVKAGGVGAVGLTGAALWKAPPSSTPPKSADVVVVGYGLAGASAAIEAARLNPKSNVLVLDRFDGGGASCRSGGVVYAGGGTEHQERFGVKDTKEGMYKYLKAELGKDIGVSDAELHDFVNTNIDNLTFLQQIGVPIGTEGEKCPFKTSYPPDQYTLYYSGSETVAPFKDIAPPAPRGHRVAGVDLTGWLLFEKIHAYVAKQSAIQVQAQTQVDDLCISDANRVTGVRCRTISGSNRLVRGYHWAFSSLSATPGQNTGGGPPNFGRAICEWLENTFGEAVEIQATRGVILCAGGFSMSSTMLDKHAPEYNGCIPIGTLGDDGAGIRLGQQAGAATKMMNRCSGWKFINPPSAFVSGMLLSSTGHRMGNEDVYGARLAERLTEDHGGKGYLIIDQAIWDQAREELKTKGGQMIYFQMLNAYINLFWNYTKASSLSDLGSKINMPTLEDKITKYNVGAVKGEDPEWNKAAQFVKPLSSPPYYAINYNNTGNAFVTMFITLGGLSVNTHGQCLHKDTGKPIVGLYAAGRNACGLAASSYVSGLSLSDCMWSGKRAGRAAVFAAA